MKKLAIGKLYSMLRGMRKRWHVTVYEITEHHYEIEGDDYQSVVATGEQRHHAEGGARSCDYIESNATEIAE